MSTHTSISKHGRHDETAEVWMENTGRVHRLFSNMDLCVCVGGVLKMRVVVGGWGLSLNTQTYKGHQDDSW